MSKKKKNKTKKGINVINNTEEEYIMAKPILKPKQNKKII